MRTLSSRDDIEAEQNARRDVYANIGSAYHMGRALSAVFGGLSGTVVAYLYGLSGGLFILPTAVVIAWDSYRQIKNPRSSPVGVFLTDSLVLLAAVALLRPPIVLLMGPIAVLITAGMVLLPWHQTLGVMAMGSAVTWASGFYESPLMVDLPPDLVALLTPMLAAAYLPSFIVLLRGVNLVLTDRQALTAVLEQRLRYEQALARCSQALLASSEGASFSSALEALLDASEVDAIVVARNTLDERGRLSREIVTIVNRSDHSPNVAADREFLWADAPTVRDHLRQGKTYFYGEGAAPIEEGLFKEAEIKSDLVIPIGVNGEWAGYISFTDYSGRATWNGYDLELLPSVARMIGAHWTRLENAARLERLIVAKDEFVASVSHELRTPLTAVVGFSGELRDGFDRLTAEERRELIELISDQALDVAHIVEDLLVVARLGGESLTLVPEEVCVITETDHVVRSLGMSEQVRYEGEGNGYAIADSGRFRQVIRNLLTNARRYGGESIVVHARYTQSEAVLTVKDNGRGVPEGSWDTIFEPYERREQPGSSPSSVGLGLTVSRQLARLMGGDLGYRYRDEWSEFEVRVPMSSRAKHTVSPSSS